MSIRKGITILLDKQVNEILENIAHQWRQPLSQINSNVSIIDKILYENKIENPRIEEKLLEIERLTKYMSNTIDDFKSYFDQTQKTTIVDLSSIINDAIEVLKENFKENDITIETSLEEGIKHGVYQNELKQIILLLLNNAKDALLDRNIFGAKITVTLKNMNKKSFIEVSDNAGGITKSVMSKVFEPHYTTKHKSQGSGIGLYMGKKIIEEKYFGSLNVSNKNDGSCFTIILSEQNDVN